MRRKIICKILCAGCICAFAHTIHANETNTIMTVNGDNITRTSLELLISARRDKGEMINDDLRKEMEQELITRLVLTQQARKLDLQKQDDVRAQQELNETAVLSQAYLRDYSEKVTPTEKELMDTYHEYLSNYQVMEYHVRQILVKEEDTAKELIKKLKDGASFTELAKKHSIDPGASINGGDIGWFRPDVFIDKRFSRAVEDLEAGEYTDSPVETRFGWHIIKVEEGPRDVTFPEYAELSKEWKEKVRDMAVMKKVNEHIKNLVDSADVKYTETSSGNVAISTHTDK